MSRPVDAYGARRFDALNVLQLDEPLDPVVYVVRGRHVKAVASLVHDQPDVFRIGGLRFDELLNELGEPLRG